MSVDVGESSLTSLCGPFFSSRDAFFGLGGAAWEKLFLVIPFEPAFLGEAFLTVPLREIGETAPIASVFVGDWAVVGSLIIENKGIHRFYEMSYMWQSLSSLVTSNIPPNMQR